MCHGRKFHLIWVDGWVGQRRVFTPPLLLHWYAMNWAGGCSGKELPEVWQSLPSPRREPRCARVHKVRLFLGLRNPKTAGVVKQRQLPALGTKAGRAHTVCMSAVALQEKLKNYELCKQRVEEKRAQISILSSEEQAIEEQKELLKALSTEITKFSAEVTAVDK